MRFKQTLACAGAGLALLATAALAQTVRTIDLPAELSYPEGIAYDPDTASLYTAGALDGTVLQIDARTGQGRVLAKAGVLPLNTANLFPAFLGMKVDAQKRLWIAGGRVQGIYVLDTRTGSVVKSMSLPGTGSVLNDLVITPDAVYVTDTFRPILWRVPVSGATIGEPEQFLSWDGIVAYGTDPNMNGIAKTADNRTLFTVHMSKGQLFKIDIATRRATPVDLGGADVTSADGLELDGNRLYLIRQAAGEVVTIDLAPDLNSGRVVSRFTNPALAFTATAVKMGNELLVVNTQFNRRTTNDPVRPFKITAVPLSLLGGGR